MSLMCIQRAFMLYLIISVGEIGKGVQGSAFRRQLQDVGSTVEESASLNSELQEALTTSLSEGEIAQANEAVVEAIDEGNTDIVIQVIVSIVNSGERTVIKRLSDILALLGNERPAMYSSVLSTALADRNNVARINAFDMLLCLQSDSNHDLCFGVDSAPDVIYETKSNTVVERNESTGYEDEDYGEVETGPLSFQGQKYLAQLMNGDYNSAAWTLVASAEEFDKWDFLRAINSAVFEGAGGAAGESMLQALRLAGRQGDSEAVSTLLAHIMVQNYRKDIISLLGKATAFASVDGLAEGVQQIVGSAIQEGGNIRSILEVMNQISAQGESVGVKDMAVVVAGVEEMKEHVDTLVEILTFALCRGGVFWNSFGQIYNKSVDLYGCSSIELSFVDGLEVAQDTCPEDVPDNDKLYEAAPLLQNCTFTNASAEGDVTTSIASTDNIDNINASAPVSRSHVSDGSTLQILQRLFGQSGDQNETATPTANIEEEEESEEISLSAVADNGNVSDSTSEPYQYECMDIDPEDELNATCAQHKSWGACEEDWMIEGNYCAQTCGFCGLVQEEDVEGSFSVASNATVLELQEEKAQSDPIKQQRQRVMVKVSECVDVIPEGNDTFSCEERKDWGACELDWMQEGDYCAKTCGFCGVPQEDAPSQSQAVREGTPVEQPNTNTTAPTPEQPSKQEEKPAPQEQEQEPASQQSTGSVGLLSILTNRIRSQEDEAAQVEGDSEQKRNAVDEPPTFRTFSTDCLDELPTGSEVNGTCVEFKEWGSCDKEWMVEGNFCAVTCGFCEGML
eukprot:TRINITY_DN6394_c0_g1_i6.p1 TRINITY_DN6394_c0_g1~~TRINITY_DN6394_c0_g1_i6.p1  ORF type:complete len:794 (-),score=143.18 TRINITY_DN6394_c0_g1_i6:584-2965(-)